MRSWLPIVSVLVMLLILSVYTASALRPSVTRSGSGDPNDIDTNPKPTQKDRTTPVYSKSAFDITPLAPAKIEELAKKLTDDERRIILNKGTEPAFCGNLLDNKKEGMYACKLCGLPLFSSDHKFNSGTGWPSYYRPVDLDHVAYVRDTDHGMDRIEINCARCGGHLGHVFEDGPKPTGLRYCLNSASLTFYEKGQATPPESTAIKTDVAYFAGGCFWGTEDLLQRTPGVINAVSGYMGGKTQNPTYKDICNHDTGHAETVMVTFDPAKVTYAQLLKFFFKYHDPTQLNRQGPDVGDQYRSAIFTANPEQLEQAKKFIDEQSKRKRFAGKKIVTEVTSTDKAGKFWPAEDYHQDYHVKNGGHCAMPAKDDDE